MFKKIGLTILLICVLTVLISCKETHTYEYLYDKEKIVSIKIVYSEYVFDDLEITILNEIEDIDGFIGNLNDIEFQKYIYVDQPTIDDKIGVMIIYQSDDYEIITYNAQEVFFAIDDTSRQGRFYCSKEDFQALLNIYDEDIVIE